MSPDDLLTAFTELAGADPDLRIDRTKVGDVDEIRLAGWRNEDTKHTFEALASDAVALFAPVGLASCSMRVAVVRPACATAP